MAVAASLKATQTFSTGTGAVGSAFTPSNNSLLVCVVHCLDFDSATPPTFTITDSLSGTWTNRINFQSQASAFNCTHIRVFTRPVTTGASMTVSYSFSGGSGVQSFGSSNEVCVFEVTGHDTTSGTSFLGLTATHPDASSSAVSFSLGGSSASSSRVFSFVDADGDDFSPVLDEGSGWTALYKHVNGTNTWHRATTEYKDGVVSTVLWGASGDTYVNAYAAMEVIAASGGGGITGTLGATEAKDTAAITGTVSGTVGVLAASEAPDTAAFTGAVRWNAALAASEAPDTALISGAVRWDAALAASEAPDIALINAAVRWNATLAASEAPDTALINATTAWNAALAATEAPDTALINATTRWNAALVATEAPDTALVQGTVTTAGEISGGLAAFEAPDAVAITGTVTGNAGILAASEAPDTAAITAAVRWNATLTASEATDTALITGTLTNAISGALGALEAPDTALITGTVTAGVSGILGALEASDIVVVTGTLGAVPISGILAATEARDTASITGSLVLPPVTGILTASEARDTARIIAAVPQELPGVLHFGRRVTISRW